MIFKNNHEYLLVSFKNEMYVLFHFILISKISFIINQIKVIQESIENIILF
jgi:hypothetical protein